MARQYKVLVNYTRNGVSIAQALYVGPHRKHADNAFIKAGALGIHGILRDCTVTFFDGFRIREDLTKTFGETPATKRIAELKSRIQKRLISVENGAEIGSDVLDDVPALATCGSCGMTWNDALISERTPAPSARCPYEYEHDEIAELRKLTGQHVGNIFPEWRV